MRKLNLFLLVFCFLSSVLLLNCNQSPDSRKGKNSTITISGAFALYPMAVKWAEEFKKNHPEVRMDISAGGAGKGITDVLSDMVDIGLVSREIHPEEVNKGAWFVAITKDAVVATVSSMHPMLNEITTNGLSKEILENIFVSGKFTGWDQAKIHSDLPIHVYTRSDASGAAESWAGYLGRKQEDLKGVGVFGDPGLAQAVIKDKAGIGYNNMIYVYDSKTKKQTNGIRVIPIDLNNNGTIDSEENFYSSIDELSEAIRTGKYPSPPARDLFFVTHGKPQRPIIKEFIRWVLTDGQKLVDESGYIQLSQEKKDEGLRKLN